VPHFSLSSVDSDIVNQHLHENIITTTTFFGQYSFGCSEPGLHNHILTLPAEYLLKSSCRRP
jgi:hypothetical protein